MTGQVIVSRLDLKTGVSHYGDISYILRSWPPPILLWVKF